MSLNNKGKLRVIYGNCTILTLLITWLLTFLGPDHLPFCFQLLWAARVKRKAEIISCRLTEPLRAVSAAHTGNFPSGFAGHRPRQGDVRRAFPITCSVTTGEISNGILRPNNPSSDTWYSKLLSN